ncbi:hypothetical protein ASE00_12925 [Sphingomonas sp. Root710]|uniref:DUF1134 domain-containing protein n=1 Tax=Sphingomonas sp. Root710 TaxID=1736594 RepID=UPI0006FD9CDE|nr:DUF1134 domain-containing protein [Sphingomonas sp. Root710]KRB82900.1 hypothetical protein ASE00_12925 [Sphingomonas sp. Root710]
MRLGYLIAGVALIEISMGRVAFAQTRTIDPNRAGDIAASSGALHGTDSPPTTGSLPNIPSPPSTSDADGPASPPNEIAAPASSPREDATAAVIDNSYAEDDVLSAAEGVFGKGAAGLADIIEKILAKQGRPNAYIAGREAGGAFIVGLRYGSGTLFHKVEGQQPIYWTGPSLGFDIGANGAKSFVLVYNLYDTADIFERYPAAEGAAYVVGGFTATYLRRGDVVLIPIRLGVGWRLGVNVGYRAFSRTPRTLPF